MFDLMQPRNLLLASLALAVAFASTTVFVTAANGDVPGILFQDFSFVATLLATLCVALLANLVRRVVVGKLEEGRELLTVEMILGITRMSMLLAIFGILLAWLCAFVFGLSFETTMLRGLVLLVVLHVLWGFLVGAIVNFGLTVKHLGKPEQTLL
jgi:hypothetical protein